MAEFGWLIDFRLTIARFAAEHVRQLGQRSANIHKPQAGDGAARVVAGQDQRQRRRTFDEIIAFPECRPGNQHEQQPGFEQKGNEEEPPEQSLASSLHF